jgi:outer membrane protein assembly factor BamD (BamD/ComL family)
LHDELEDPRVKRTLQGLFRPSLGQWNGFLREVLSAYQRTNRLTEMLVSELSDAYNKKRRDRPAMAKAYNLIVNYTQNRFDSATSSLSIRQFCDTFINYRNKTIGHGAINRYHCEQMNDPLFAALEEMLGQLSFLQAYRLVYIEDVRVRRGNYTHEMVSFMGSTPPSRLKEAYVTGNQDEYRVEEQLYLCRRGENVPILSLHPLVIAWQNDVLFLNESERDRDIEYLSYQSGQIKRPDRLLEDFKDNVGSVIARDSTEPSFDRLRQDAIDEKGEQPTPYEKGCEAFDDENWAAAISFLEQVDPGAPHFDDAQVRLSEASLQQDLLERYNRAQQWMEQQGLDQAEAILTKLDREAPGYRDVHALLSTIRMEKAERQSLQRLYDQAKRALQARQWDRAFDLLGRLHSLRADFEDTSTLFATQKRLHDLYDQALESMSDRNWAEALTTLNQLKVLEPAYKDVPELLQRTDRELESEAQMAKLYSQAKVHIALEEWEKALELLDQVDDQLDGYRDVNELIELAQNKTLVECPRCGTLTPSGHKFCGKCGAAIQTWICWQCQAPVPVNRKFCGLCGAPREKPSPPTVSCPQCGHSNPARRKFCGQCGYAFRK